MYNRKVSIWEIILGVVITVLVAGATVTFLEYQTSPRGRSLDFGLGEAIESNKVDSFFDSLKEDDGSLALKRGLADYDQDGLLNWEELQYSSYINDRDSDNDGYSDGREIQNGFNPKGEGELSPSLQKIKQEIAAAKKKYGSDVIPEKYSKKVRKEMSPEKTGAKTTPPETEEGVMPERGFSENLKTYLFSISLIGPLFNNMPLPFKGLFLVLILFSLAFLVLKVGFSIFVLNKMNNWWGDTPSNTETSLKIVALLLVFDFVYGGVEFLVKLNFLNNIPLSFFLFLLGLILNLALFVFLMAKFYKTGYKNGIKIAITSKLLVAIILAAVGMVFSAVGMFLYYVAMLLTDAYSPSLYR